MSSKPLAIGYTYEYTLPQLSLTFCVVDLRRFITLSSEFANISVDDIGAVCKHICNLEV